MRYIRRSVLTICFDTGPCNPGSVEGNWAMRQMTSAIGDLWRGEMPLGQVFWSLTIVFGTLFNLLATGVGLMAMAGGMPAPAAVALHLLPLPYNFLVLVGVWRSADSFPGHPFIAAFARVAAAAWFALMIVI
jgi:hypothetical protein